VTTPAIGEGDLLIIGSGSGRTASLIGHGSRASEVGARVVLITGTSGSPIEEKADIVVHILAPSPKTETETSTRSVQPMANLFEQSMGLLLDMLVMQLMEELGETADEMFTRHANLE
jgi:6-phospho-3-hexuloisomerase